MSEETKKQFWGPEEVIEVIDTGNTTHRGVAILEVITKRSEEETRKRTTTEIGFNTVVTEEPKDWNYVRDIKLEHIVRETMNICTDYGMDGAEMQPFVNSLSMALGNRLDHAAHIRFEGDDAEYVPGGNIYNDWSLAKAENIIEHKNESGA